MENDEGKVVDLYVPRRCSATGRLIPATDHGSVQITAHNGEDLSSGSNDAITFCISGFVRKRGESDAAINRIFAEKGLLTFNK